MLFVFRMFQRYAVMCLECFELLDNIQLPTRLNSAGFVRVCVFTIGECAGRPAASRINPHCVEANLDSTQHIPGFLRCICTCF